MFIKLTKENVYLRSDDYLDDIIPRYYIQELENRINELLNKNNNLLNENLYLKSEEYQNKILSNYLKEKELMIQKIDLLGVVQ